MSQTITEPPIVQKLAQVSLRGHSESPAKGSQKVQDILGYKYNHLLPGADPDVKYPPLEEFTHEEPGLRVSNPLQNPLDHLLKEAQVTELTPSIGTEVTGIQLSKLDSKARDELAVLVARRGVVVFREQDFADQPVAFFGEFGKHYGQNLHVHPTSAHPEGHPELHLIYRDGGHPINYFNNKLSSVAWHSDVSYELQPPGLTALFILELPSTGGDTVWSSQVEAYNRLSEPFKKRLEGLQVVHSGVEQAEYSRSGERGGVVRREPVKNIHPLVRTHPVTGERALYINPQFSRGIVGYKDEESANLLNFLYDHIARSDDFHVRIKWQRASVVLWDNRTTVHTALLDYKTAERRHAARITPQAERPFFK